jgi:hypothetical protein
MNAYCDRQSVDMTAIAFLFDGRRLRAEQTPDEVLSVTFEQNLQLVISVMICQVSDCLFTSAVSARDGRWRRNRRHASPDRRLPASTCVEEAALFTLALEDSNLSLELIMNGSLKELVKLWSCAIAEGH